MRQVSCLSVKAVRSSLRFLASSLIDLSLYISTIINTIVVYSFPSIQNKFAKLYSISLFSFFLYKFYFHYFMKPQIVPTIMVLRGCIEIGSHLSGEIKPANKFCRVVLRFNSNDMDTFIFSFPRYYYFYNVNSLSCAIFIYFVHYIWHLSIRHQCSSNTTILIFCSSSTSKFFH